MKTKIKVDEIVRRSEKAALVAFDFVEFWIPFSQVPKLRIARTGSKGVEIWIPDWILTKQGLRSHIVN